MKRLPTLVAGGLCAALLLAGGGGRGEPHREAPRQGPGQGGGFGGGRMEAQRFSAPAPRGDAYGPGPARGYGEGPPMSRGYRVAPRSYGSDYGLPARGEPYERPRAGYAPPAYGGRYAEPDYAPRAYRPNSLGRDWREQQEEARAGVRQGQMVPLGRVIQGIGHRAAGRPLDAGIEYQDGRAVYRVRWMTARGRRVDYIVDAASGAILSEH